MKKAVVLVFILVIVAAITGFYLSLPTGTSFRDSWKIMKARSGARQLTEQELHGAFQLEIDEAGMTTLEKCRVKALERGNLAEDNQVYVGGIVKVNDHSYPVKVKLKGSLNTHWKHPIRWSFRIIITDGQTLPDGSKVFSIQSSLQRGYYVGKYYQALLETFGVLNIDIQDIPFSLNGMHMPHYTMEEFFDASILERQNRPIGPIIKFDYDTFWESIDWKDTTMPEVISLYKRTYREGPIKSYDLKSGTYHGWENDSKSAIAKLDSFRRGTLTTNEVFDLASMGRYFAVNSIFGNQHPAFLTNLRFYYNPISELLEPIGYNMERIRPISEAKAGTVNFWPHEVSYDAHPFIAQLFEDTLMRDSYLRQLDSLAKPSIISPIINSLRPDLSGLKKQYRSISYKQSDFIETNILAIREKLEGN